MQVVLIIIDALISAKLFIPSDLLSSVLDMSNITPWLILITLVYFILGYGLFSLIYALVGSTVSKPEDVQSANTPVALLAVVGFYLSYFSMMSPGSNINVFASLFPLSAPFCMPFRIMMGTATPIQIVGSLAILIVCVWLVAKISIKVYSSAILNYGTKLSIKDALKIYKNK